MEVSALDRAALGQRESCGHASAFSEPLTPSATPAGPSGSATVGQEQRLTLSGALLLACLTPGPPRNPSGKLHSSQQAVSPVLGPKPGSQAPRVAWISPNLKTFGAEEFILFCPTKHLSPLILPLFFPGKCNFKTKNMFSNIHVPTNI